MASCRLEGRRQPGADADATRRAHTQREPSRTDVAFDLAVDHDRLGAAHQVTGDAAALEHLHLGAAADQIAIDRAGDSNPIASDVEIALDGLALGDEHLVAAFEARGARRSDGRCAEQEGGKQRAAQESRGHD